ncbi:hypothetical protein SEUBUCD646_0P04190 [Saccharomyces eubayanus]|uniref:CUR1-like protein n=2 Tax=Saccharomyces TaxID=4930 RepID=A0ABN8VIX8_SACEU|nr:hypothetical protein SEUBUCD650_0P04200 [Saccharomyces eubayanus]CAI1821489.1 hypothetical protein SEUBUCD646_0P04190 [Saccharomyces eubayanus]
MMLGLWKNSAIARRTRENVIEKKGNLLFFFKKKNCGRSDSLLIFSVYICFWKIKLFFIRNINALPPLFNQQTKLNIAHHRIEIHLMATACIFQPNLLKVNASDEPSNMIRKRRRIQQSQPGSLLRENKLQPQIFLRNLNHCYILSLYKEITCQLIGEILHQKISKIWGKVYIPSYELISDIHGNQLYVEQGVDENKLVSEILKRLNPNLIDSEATQMLFDDYHLELSHTGDGICISSLTDRFHKEFSFNNAVTGTFRLCGTSVRADSSGTVYGVMQIEIPIDENTSQAEHTFSGLSTFHIQTDEPNDTEQEIRAFNLSRQNQENIIRREITRRLKGHGELYNHRKNMRSASSRKAKK